MIFNRSDIDTKSIKSTVWHGRMEEIGRDIIIDGAHNVPAIKEFVDNALAVSKNRNKKIKLLISIVKDKEVEEMFDIITAGLDVKKYYLTSLDSYRRNDIKKLYNSLNILLEKIKKSQRLPAIIIRRKPYLRLSLRKGTMRFYFA